MRSALRLSMSTRPPAANVKTFAARPGPLICPCIALPSSMPSVAAALAATASDRSTLCVHPTLHLHVPGRPGPTLYERRRAPGTLTLTRPLASEPRSMPRADRLIYLFGIGGKVKPETPKAAGIGGWKGIVLCGKRTIGCRDGYDVDPDKRAGRCAFVQMMRRWAPMAVGKGRPDVATGGHGLRVGRTRRLATGGASRVVM